MKVKARHSALDGDEKAPTGRASRQLPPRGQVIYVEHDGPMTLPRSRNMRRKRNCGLLYTKSGGLKTRTTSKARQRKRNVIRWVAVWKS
jgi:hypothetical protein